ncbi:hypothetical protein KBB76_02995 [Candidatus Saccharibacteria bacterium]|jgi:hypothetical protein|nr:hypothetical protein [Candidatus Saccharibacteria bacterium]
MSRQEVYTKDENLQEAHDKNHCVTLSSDQVIRLKKEAEASRNRQDKENRSKQRELSHKIENKQKHPIRTLLALGLVGIVGFFGAQKMNIFTGNPSETKEEIEITKMIEQGNKGNFSFLKGRVETKPGANVRENPYVLEDKGSGETNKVEIDKISEYTQEDKVPILNPVVMGDLRNSANGDWYGFQVKSEDDDTKWYWVNEQNIITKNNKHNTTTYNGKTKIGVLVQ